MNKREYKRTYAPVACEMRAAGAMLREIAERFDITVPAARRWTLGVACPIDHKTEVARLNTLAKVARNAPVKALARKMRGEGKNYDEIAWACKIAKSTAMDWCRDVRKPVKKLTPAQVRRKASQIAYLDRLEQRRAA